ncbi:hypothetical protein AAMO2058_000545500 [Amorphochlora amoebiformis]
MRAGVMSALLFSHAVCTPPKSQEEDGQHMRAALEQAQIAAERDEVPIGAILVDDLTGEVLAQAYNSVEDDMDVTSHAEILCLRKAAQRRGTWRLNSTSLYVTIEPCPMCLSALSLARVSSIIYGEKNVRLGSCGSWLSMHNETHPFHTFERIQGGVLAKECGEILVDFFKTRRSNSAHPNKKPSEKKKNIFSRPKCKQGFPGPRLQQLVRRIRDLGGKGAGRGRMGRIRDSITGRIRR